MTPDQDYFTVQQLAKYSHIGVKTLYQAVRDREIKHVKIGKKVIIKKRDFEDWFDRKAKTTLPDTTIPALTPVSKKPVFSF
jgi:excisionase family DNA binding protein